MNDKQMVVDVQSLEYYLVMKRNAVLTILKALC
jgi:hypothetical protein